MIIYKSIIIDEFYKATGRNLSDDSLCIVFAEHIANLVRKEEVEPLQREIAELTKLPGQINNTLMQ